MIGTDHTQKITTLIDRKTLLAMIPLSDRAIYNMEKRGGFPLRIVLTSRNVAWDLAEIEERKQSSDKAIRLGSASTSGTPPVAK